MVTFGSDIVSLLSDPDCAAGAVECTNRATGAAVGINIAGLLFEGNGKIPLRAGDLPDFGHGVHLDVRMTTRFNHPG